jgi:hypothetical protein
MAATKLIFNKKIVRVFGADFLAKDPDPSSVTKTYIKEWAMHTEQLYEKIDNHEAELESLLQERDKKNDIIIDLKAKLNEENGEG